MKKKSMLGDFPFLSHGGKSFLVVKQMLVLLLAFNLNVFSAISAQQINEFKVQNATLKNCIKKVEQLTGLGFMYNGSELNKVSGITLELRNADVTIVLESVLKGTGYTYKLMEGVIAIMKAEPVPAAPAQKRTVKGIVKDRDGSTLPGVSVLVKGTQTGVATDIDGRFEIKLDDDPNVVLVFSFVGMKPKEVKIGQNKDLNVVLESSAESLEEVVVTGYQTISKERATGAFGTITSKDIEVKMQPNLSSLLEGQATGVVLNKDGKIEIRGVSTFTAKADPLIVVDGYPIEGDLESINPENIASITVLKDGVAASIYGSRAANGVIVIATTKGVKDSFRIAYKGIVSTTLKPQLSALNRASTSDYIDAELDLFYQNPNDPSTTDKYNMSRVTWLMMQAREGAISSDAAMAEINELRKVNGQKQAEKAFFRNQFSHQHNLSISGGSEKNTFNAAINYLGAEKSMVHADNSRLILDIKNDWAPNKYINLGIMANMVYTKDEDPVRGWSDLLEYASDSNIQPYDNLYDPVTGKSTDVFSTSTYKIETYKRTPGMKDWTYNPIEDLAKEMITRENMQLRVGGTLRVNIIDGLNVEAGGVWNRGNLLKKTIFDRDAYRVRIAYNDATSKENNANHYLPDGAIVDEMRNVNESWTMRTQVNFNRSFKDGMHRVTFLAGNEIRQEKYDNNTLSTRTGYNPTAGSFVPVNIKDYNSTKYNADMLFGKTITINPERSAVLEEGKYTFRDVRFVSWYGNASYEYNNRFIVSGSVRLDLTNFFGTDPKYRYKPLWSVGGTYKLSEEKFFDVDWINRLYVRGSYGINGNISLDEGPFLILSAGSYSSMTGGVSYGVASPPNNQLRWERTGTTNFGVDVAMLDNRLTLSLDYYHKISTDLLAKNAVDPTTGFASLTRNAGQMTNDGVEVSLSADVIKSNDFLWKSQFNFSYNNNKVKEYNVTRLYSSSYMGANVMAKGFPAGALFGYRYAGLNNNGETMAYHADGRRDLIGNMNPEDVTYCGTTRPKYDLSWTNTLKYKDIQLSFMFIAKLGHSFRKDAFTGSNYLNRHVSERWQKPGDEATKIYPRLLSWNMDMFDFPYCDFLVAKANYLKLRDVTLSYNLPQDWTSTIGLSNARVYFQTRNLFRVTAKGVDIDPEITELNTSGYSGPSIEQAFTSLPLRPEFYFGLSFNF